MTLNHRIHIAVFIVPPICQFRPNTLACLQQPSQMDRTISKGRTLMLLKPIWQPPSYLTNLNKRLSSQHSADRHRQQSPLCMPEMQGT